MKRQEKINKMKKDGWCVVIYASGRGCQAEKNNGLKKVSAKSITELHRKIYGW